MVLLRSLVQEWVQPKPTVTNGEAWVGLDCSPDAAVAGVSSASVVLDAATVLSPDWLAEAGFSVEGDVEFTPNCLAEGVVEFDAEGPTDENVGRRDAVAVVPVSGVCFADVVGDAWAGVFLGVEVDALVAVSGDAEVEIAHYSSGATPVFPFRFPMVFMDAGLLVSDAAAVPDFDGDVPLIADCLGDATVLGVAGWVEPEASLIEDNEFDVWASAEIGFTGGVDQLVAGFASAGLEFEGSVPFMFTGLLPTFFPFDF